MAASVDLGDDAKAELAETEVPKRESGQCKHQSGSDPAAPRLTHGGARW